MAKQVLSPNCYEPGQESPKPVNPPEFEFTPGPEAGPEPETDPNLNVGPDGYCTATPCGSSGQMPERTCAELGLPEDQCGSDGTYPP